MNADPENFGADLSDPQSFNGYSYVTNNPLMYTDPWGSQGIMINSPPDGSTGDSTLSITYDPYSPSGQVGGPNPFLYYGQQYTIGALPLTTAIGQTQDRVLGGVKGFVSDLLSFAQFLGAPEDNVRSVRSFLNLVW